MSLSLSLPLLYIYITQNINAINVSSPYSDYKSFSKKKQISSYHPLQFVDNAGETHLRGGGGGFNMIDFSSSRGGGGNLP